MTCSLYGDYLAAAGHEVHAVSSLSDAKATLAKLNFDVVVTDLILPEGDGMEVLRHVKETHPTTEVLVITALDKVDPAVRAIKSGAAEYLLKPIASETLQHAVTRALNSRQLLRENAQLRQHVTLLEMGQRIATTLDRERLLAVSSSSIAQVTGAQAVMIYLGQSQAPQAGVSPFPLLEGDEEGLRLVGALGLDESAELQLVEKLTPRLGLRTTLEPLRLSDELLPAPFRSAWVYPAAEGAEVLGLVVLLFDANRNDIHPSALYLAQNLGIALKNLGRFAEVEDLAYLDDLTHLFNTRYLDLVLDREIKHAQESESAFSLLFLDLDYFKNVNDTHGHIVGSKLLLEIARIIKGCVRDKDIVARYGGDEYTVLLRSTDSGGALKVAERIRRTIESHHFLAREGYGLSVTTCIGIASFPEHAQNKVTLLDLADRAMYRGKKTTRNVIYMASSGLEATPADRHSVPTG